MNAMATSVLLLLSAGASGVAPQEPAAADQPTATVILRLAGQAEPDEALQTKLKALALDLLKTSNFNTLAHPHIMNQTVPQVHEQYRQAAAQDHLIITYEAPVMVTTAGGDISVHEIVVGLARDDYASSLFTVDAEGRAVGHAKYDGGAAIALRQSISTAPKSKEGTPERSE